MTDEPVTPKKRVRKTAADKPVLRVVEGKVEQHVVPQEELEVESDELTDGETPRVSFSTPDGEAVYEYSGDCFDCTNEGETTPVFHCATHPIRADQQLGDQLAAFWADGSHSTPLCMKHYRRRLGGIQPVEVEYKIIESNKFG